MVDVVLGHPHPPSGRKSSLSQLQASLIPLKLPGSPQQKRVASSEATPLPKAANDR